MPRQKPTLARLIDQFPAVKLLFATLYGMFRRLTQTPMGSVLRSGPPSGQRSAPGQKEQAVLDMVKKTTPQGNPQAVLNAIDNFAWSKQGFLMNIGDVKGTILDSVIDQYQPRVALELGSYIGYSAIRMARKLPPGGKLYGIDPNETHVRIAREMIEHAGLSDKAEIIQGILETSIPDLRRRGVQTVDLALIDHVKTLYLQDLLIMQQNGLFRKGSVVVGDNVLTPGSPDFRQHMATSADFTTKEHLTNIEYSHYVPDIVTVSEYTDQAAQR